MMSRPKGWAREEKKKAFIKSVNKAKVELDLRQEDLCGVLGVQQPQVSTLLNNPDRMSAERLRNLIEALNLPLMTVAEFLGYTKKQIIAEMKTEIPELD